MRSPLALLIVLSTFIGATTAHAVEPAQPEPVGVASTLIPANTVTSALSAPTTFVCSDDGTVCVLSHNELFRNGESAVIAGRFGPAWKDHVADATLDLFFDEVGPTILVADDLTATCNEAAADLTNLTGLTEPQRLAAIAGLTEIGEHLAVGFGGNTSTSVADVSRLLYFGGGDLLHHAASECFYALAAAIPEKVEPPPAEELVTEEGVTAEDAPAAPQAHAPPPEAVPAEPEAASPEDGQPPPVVGSGTLPVMEAEPEEAPAATDGEDGGSDAGVTPNRGGERKAGERTGPIPGAAEPQRVVRASGALPTASTAVTADELAAREAAWTARHAARCDGYRRKLDEKGSLLVVGSNGAGLVERCDLPATCLEIPAGSPGPDGVERASTSMSCTAG